MNLGRATISPKTPLVAGSYATVTYIYTAGHPLDDSGYLKIVFRSVGDFGVPQFTDPSAPDYSTLHTTGSCRPVPRWDNKGHTRPWNRALLIQITEGYLDRGERVVVVFGDRSGGSPGWQVQTFREHTFEFKTLVDPIATYRFKELPESPEISIVAGPPARVVCIAPSQIQTGEPFAYFLRLEDLWGNPRGKPRRFYHQGFHQPGVQSVTGRDSKTGLSAQSNPIDVLSTPASLHPYWADLHGQSEETIGSNTIEDYFEFARHYGLLDICAHQGNDFQVTDTFWDKINEMTRQFYEPHAFVTFPGYEWSGNTPLGGDRNVYYKSEGGIITRSSHELLPGGASKYKDSSTAGDLFRNLKGPAPFVFAHVGGRYANLDIHDEDVEVAVEVHSAWGTSEWLVEDALCRGYRIGICANSDGHKTRPGASYPGAGEFGSFGGLTCVLAERLDRDSVHAAIMARHFYATTGHRPLLDVMVKTARGRSAIMGDMIAVGDGWVVLKVRVLGTRPIDRVEVRNGLDAIRTLRPFGKQDLGRRIKIVWSGAEVRGRARMVKWDGMLHIRGNRILRYSPINFWNPTEPLRQVRPNCLKWKSMTTGGLAGAILELERADAGIVKVETVQGRAGCKVESIGVEPKTWRYGGLHKQIQIYRLPDRQESTSFSFEIRLHRLRRGDNPIYVCVHQEDGHMAWSSPIYVVV